MTFFGLNNPNLANYRSLQTAQSGGWVGFGFGGGGTGSVGRIGNPMTIAKMSSIFGGGSYGSGPQINVYNYGSNFMSRPMFPSFGSPMMYRGGWNSFGFGGWNSFGLRGYNGGLGRGFSRFGFSPILSPALYLCPETFVASREVKSSTTTSSSSSSSSSSTSSSSSSRSSEAQGSRPKPKEVPGQDKSKKQPVTPPQPPVQTPVKPTVTTPTTPTKPTEPPKTKEQIAIDKTKQELTELMKKEPLVKDMLGEEPEVLIINNELHVFARKSDDKDDYADYKIENFYNAKKNKFTKDKIGINDLVEIKGNTTKNRTKLINDYNDAIRQYLDEVQKGNSGDKKKIKKLQSDIKDYQKLAKKWVLELPRYKSEIS